MCGGGGEVVSQPDCSFLLFSVFYLYLNSCSAILLLFCHYNQKSQICCSCCIVNHNSMAPHWFITINGALAQMSEYLINGKVLEQGNYSNVRIYAVCFSKGNHPKFHFI